MDRLRHRDQLLSLKFSTIEACFSVPMLNLTLPNFPFVVVFAVKVLGWKADAIGWMAALPHLCNFLQPLFLALLAGRFSNYQLLVLTFSLGALPWGMAGALPMLGTFQGTCFVAMLVIGTVASSIASVAWSASISEIVPERISGSYFARRNLIFGGWTLIAVMVAGHIAEWNGNSMVAFASIFCAAGISRLVGLFFLSRMKFPATVMERRSRGVGLADLLTVLRDNNYRNLCVFVGLWGLLLNAAMPFYTMFLVGRLNLGLGTVVIMTTLASLGGLVTLQSWGRLSDRYGNRPVLQVAALIWAMTALLMWSISRPGWTIHLFIGYFVVGAMTAGFQLTQFNLMLRLAPAARRAPYVAVFLAVTSLFTAAGPVIGGELLKALPADLGFLFHRTISSYHLLFVCAAFGCVLATNLIQRVREPAEQPMLNVLREMRTMRSFNPMLSMLSVGELLLTPRGLVALTRRSLRSVRQQVKALEGVGGEIASGGLELLRKPPDSQEKE
jgi:MFS family permease